MTVSRLLMGATVAAVTPSALADACLADPVQMNPITITSTFGKTRNLSHYSAPRTHWGVDIHARNGNTGADLLAADNGTVIGAGFWGAGYGNRVAIKRDNGDILLYSHMSKVEPSLKSGGAIGFKDAEAGMGQKRVATGDKIGVAGGTSNHMDRSDGLPIHLHLEYVTGYGGAKIRETNDGTDTTRSRYMRNALSYMCKTYRHTADAGPVTQGTGGAAPAPVGGGVSGQPNVPSSDEQVKEAQAAQPSVTDTERYGMPDTPPYETYEGMSEAQIIEAEMLRRSLDTEWETRLTEWSTRGLWVEIARMRGAKVWLQARIAEKHAAIEAMLAIRLAYNTNAYFNPRMEGAYSRAVSMAARQKAQQR
ncbi:M23 family metallopeptidase [Cupriavidus sp. TMH.W2]|uniref:M23 family metallopeptidase n=1 Tax=Cupriavidus sp. TMH.W2 TaxID=3434465 RepID=UPI003D7781E6